MTLSQWAKDFGHTLYRADGKFACDAAGFGADKIEDFKVTVANNGWTLHFDGPFLTLPVIRRDDFLSLSYYTLCRISDTLNVASIEGMVNAVERGVIRGMLTTDTLGNFLMIE